MPSETPPAAETRTSRRVVPLVVALAIAAAAAGVGAVGVALLALDERGRPGDLTGDGTVEVGASADGYAVWARNDDGSPIRWDPCSPVEVVVNPEGAPVDGAAFLQDVVAAVDDLREATGLDLRVAGTTDEEPTAGRPAYREVDGRGTWAPVLVAWASPGQHELPLRSFDRGIGAPVAVGPPGARVYVTGQVVLNRERHELVAGRSDRAVSWGATVLHELAHVLGLDHVRDREQLMSVHPGSGPVALGEGDLAGLAAVGAGGGCLDVPAPRPVETDLSPPAS